MTKFYLDPTTLERRYVGAPFIKDDIYYTEQGATEELFLEQGCTVVEVQATPSDAYYENAVLNNDGSWTSTPKDLAEVKATLNSLNDQHCANCLYVTDWVFIRKQETGAAVADSILAERTAIRQNHQTVEANIASATSISELEAIAPNGIVSYN